MMQRLRHQVFLSRSLCTTIETKTNPSKLRKYLNYVGLATAIVPPVFAAGFIVNLKYDDEFLHYFHTKYPELIDQIGQYITLDTTSIGNSDEESKEVEEIDVPPSELNAIVKTVSGKQYRVKLLSSVGIDEVTKAIQYQGAAVNDAVVDVYFEEDMNEDMKDETERMSEPSKKSSDAIHDPQVKSTWPTELPPRKKKTSIENELKWHLISLRGKEKELNEEKLLGLREIDVIDADIAAIVKQKEDIKKVLPRKKFLYIF